MTNKRIDRPEIKLKDYIPPNRFRTVESFDTMHGSASELRTELELKDGFMDSLTFKVPWDGKLYAYARPTDGFYKLCEQFGLFADKTTTLYFQDWDTKFLLAIEKTEDDKRQVLTFFASSEDVRDMLENCCRIEAQKASKPRK